MSQNNQEGSSNTGIVAIFALVLVALGAAYFLWWKPAGSENNTTVIKEKETIVEDDDDGPSLDIDILPGGDDDGEKKDK